MQRRLVIPLAATVLLAATAAFPAGAQAEASACPDPADKITPAWFLPFPSTLRPLDGSAITPERPSYLITHTNAACYPAEVTVQRPGGADKHRVKIDQIVENPDVGYYQYGSDTLDYPTGTGAWQVTEEHFGGESVTLAEPVDFRIRRGSVVNLTVPPAAPRQVVATGLVQYWTSSGEIAASPGRTVLIRGNDDLATPGPVLAKGVTDAQGRYSIKVPLPSTRTIYADTTQTSTLGFAFSNSKVASVVQPTTLTGTAAPTSGGVIKPGTKMSTYGTLKVMYTSGQTGPFANQQVLVQTRPHADPAAPYTTVATATTSSTGYYYANWSAPRVDVDVRVAYRSPYSSIASAFRWLRVVDV